MGKGSRFAFMSSLLLASAMAARAQTFDLNQGGNNSPAQSTKKSKKNVPSQPAEQAPEGGIGWGSGIEVARESRTAQQALDKGDYQTAVTAANRAAHSAPGNTALWFLLGYSARLAGDYQASANAYKRGLQNQPSSIQGLSGLAQTYAKMGRSSDAQDLLKQVLAANPKSVNDLLLAGELALNSDPKTALDLLKRADSLQASARGELLIARAYERLNEPDASKQYLDRALNRAPNDPSVLRAVGAYYRDERQYDQAIAVLQKAAQSKDPETLAELAYTYTLAGKKKEAVVTYAQAASGSPKNAGLQLSAAQALVNVGEFVQAGGFLKRAETQDPNQYRLHAIRGQIAGAENHDEEAIREYRFALNHLPTAVPEGPLYPISIRLSLYELYQRADQTDPAERTLADARTAMGNIPGVDDSVRPEYLRLKSLIESAGGNYVAAETDIKEAARLDPNNVNIVLNYANLLWKTDRGKEAAQMYDRGLKLDPNNNAALTALGYLSREIGDNATAEKYFTHLAELYPDDYVPYLAMGDLYTADHRYPDAQKNYEMAHQLAPNNPLVVAGGINSALEAHALPTAKTWVERAAANPSINDNPPVMRERERYLTRSGNYEESAQLGYKVLEKLPRDPEAPVYLAYDLLFLNRDDEAYQVVQKYEPILPKDKDLHLIAGYYHAHRGEMQNAVDEFTIALNLDPNNPTGYMNRGYVLNDLRQPSKAEQDFETAIKMRPDYGEAHLGLAFSNLQLRRANPALKEAAIASRLLGESAATHLAMAEGYRQQMMLRKAEAEYRAALKFSPNDVQTHLALADALYRMHRYEESITALKATLGLGPDDSLVYAELARSYAQLRQKEATYQAVAQAEKHGDDSKVLMATGEALLALGDHSAAMERYSRALDAPGSDRVEVRLALARLFASSGKRTQAQQQVSFALAEARIGEAQAVTPENLIEAADVLMSISEFDLAKKYFLRAQSDGADPESVDVGLANAYLAEGQTQSAAALLHSFAADPEGNENYEYLIAMSNVYRQQQNSTEALISLARANRIVEGNESALQAEMYLADETGRPVTDKVNIVPQASFAPVFEDINIYQLDAKIRGITNPALLPTPRYSYESLGDARYRIHIDGLPLITGLVAERNQRGTLSFPNQLLIEQRNTFDTIFNGGINPVVHLGDNTITFNPGVQFTIRRDTLAPVNMNQNLFRQFLYMYTSSFFNWVSITGNAMREAGPFTDQNLHSRDAAAGIEFNVGRPWGKTSLITGYQVRDILFRPTIAEYFTTNSYAGVQRKFGTDWTIAIYADYLRSWRVQDVSFAIAQALRPGFRVDYVPIDKHWSVHAAGTWSQGEGFHAYDNVANEVTFSYTRGLQRQLSDGSGEVAVTYPIRLSVGLQQQSFYDFPGSSHTQVLPIIRLNLF
jgi:tetratricopeptide (TPR) repeat protein